MTVLVGLLEDKLFDLGEKYARDFNKLLYGNGVADAEGAGRAWHCSSQTTRQSASSAASTAPMPAYTWWRNLAYTTAFGVKVTGTPALGDVGRRQHHHERRRRRRAADRYCGSIRRKLTRYGGEPDLIVAGSDFIGAMETEIRANGSYTMTGFKKSQDAAMGDMYFAGTRSHLRPDAGRSWAQQVRLLARY